MLLVGSLMSLVGSLILLKICHEMLY
jgi:hypothetical protein